MRGGAGFMMHKPLLGVKIVDLSMYVAGPAAARMMGEWVCSGKMQ